MLSALQMLIFNGGRIANPPERLGMIVKKTPSI